MHTVLRDLDTVRASYTVAAAMVQQTYHLYRRTDASFVEKEPPFKKRTCLGENKYLGHGPQGD
jgi:hypothetical protein